MYRLYTLYQSDEWLQIIQRMPEYDFYDTPEYHRLDTNGDALLFVYEEKDIIVCLPMILREIPGTHFKDVTSVYGYAGPLVSNPQMMSAVAPGFRTNLNAFFQKEKVVSAFSRLDPLKKQQTELLEGLGNTCLLNQTVYLDLTLSQEEQWRMYSASLKRQLRRIADKGIKSEVASSTEEWLTFGKIYNEAMRGRNAAPQYYFPPTYFLQLRKACTFETLLLVSRYRGEIIAGGLFTVCNGIMQYHLGAVKSEYVTFSPLKQIVDEARLRGGNKGIRALHLGGGYGGEENPLFAFKSRFSPLRKEFRVWKFCTNEEAYTQLIEMQKELQSGTENKVENDTETFSERSYFPLYRYK